VRYQFTEGEDAPMKAGIRKGIAAAAAVAAAATAIVVGNAGSSAAATPSLRAFGITGNGNLMATFTTDRPDILDWVRVVTGLNGDTALKGIDFRVQDKLLYGVGDKGGIHTIKLPTPPNLEVVVTKVSQLTIPLYGTNFGVDFNPAADRLRVISDNGQNLRHNLNDHTTIEDFVLTTPPGSTTRGVTAAAYTNNDLNPETATTLFDINTTTDQVVLQSPANNGFLAPAGSLGVDAGPNAGFDIYSDLTNGKTVSATAFAAIVPSGGTAATSTLYGVNLLTGATTAVGMFPLDITDIAIALDTY
jgi:hypothetical protein